MSEFKGEIKEWLKRIGKDRVWLAKMAYATKPTVDGWLATRGVIPMAKQDLIKALMSKTEASSVFPEPGRENWKSFAVLLNRRDYELLSAVARLERMTPEQWAERELVRLSRQKGVAYSINSGFDS